MGDERLRELERTWRASGSPGDERAFLRERVRTGSLSPSRFELLERMGHFDGPVDPVLAEWSASLAEAIVWTTEADALPRVPRWAERLPPTAALYDCWEPRGIGPNLLHISRLVATRRAALHETGWIEGPRARSVAGGRLVVYYPDVDLCDGAAEASSGGFLDVHNIPPPATWVSLTEDPARGSSCERMLLAWIPPRLIGAVYQGIKVNPENCIVWASPSEHPFLGRIHAAGWQLVGDPFAEP